MSKVTRSLRSRDVQVATSLASRFVHIVGGSAALCSYRAMPPSFRTLKGPIVVLSRPSSCPIAFRARVCLLTARRSLASNNTSTSRLATRANKHRKCALKFESQRPIKSSSVASVIVAFHGTMPPAIHIKT